MAAPPLIAFLPYQRQWLEDRARFKIGMFARQTGKTYTTCAEIVDDCIQAEIKGRRVRWVILSRGERQAAEAMDEAIKPFCKAFYAVYRTVLAGRQAPTFSTEAFVVDKPEGGSVTYKALEVRFPSGSRITALPANPDTARGYSANVFLDEFAFHKDSREIWRALFPVVSKAGLRLRITSTPNGKANKFYELWTAQDTGWSRHEVSLRQAVTEGLDRDIEALRAALNDDDAWAQEYELQFLEEAGAWLSFDLITAVEHADAGQATAYQGGDVYIGNDIARRRDLWVAWVLERVGDVLWTREIVECKGISFAEQDAILDDLVARYRVRRIAMDQTGMGEKPVEDAKRRYGSLRVEGVLMTGATPLNVATTARQAFEDRKIRIPAGNVVLRADLHKIKKVVGATGAPRLLADRDGAGHADRAWACFMALAAAAGGGITYAYDPAPPPAPTPDGDDQDDAPGLFGPGTY
ncbi:terminase large subunit domain-containing protein [Pararhodospirillum photometricum]|nr:terminase family protein [Pararhodospirillum photometricum]